MYCGTCLATFRRSFPPKLQGSNREDGGATSSEATVYIYNTTRRRISEDSTLQIHRYETVSHVSLMILYSLFAPRMNIGVSN
jgi:hypothetical protein